MKDVSGWFVYRNIVIQQHDEIKTPFYKLFESLKPKQILEIGTASGGLTLLLRDVLNELSMNDTQIHTYDVDEKHFLNEHIESGQNIEVFIKNIFNHQYDGLIELDEIKSFIKRDGVTIVLCDGGSKKNEFKILSELLKDGDIIMAHDYSPNEEVFYQNVHNKIWNWLEIQDSDINEVVNNHNLKPYMDEEFKNVVWVCKMK